MELVSVTFIYHADCLTLMATTEVLDAAVNDILDLSLTSFKSAFNGELHCLIFCLES